MELAVASARNHFWGLADAAAADATLRRAERAVSETKQRDELTALRVRLMGVAGRVDEALAAAGTLLDEPGVGDHARLHAALSGTELLLMAGRGEEAIAVADAWLPLGRRHGDDLPTIEAALLHAQAFALWPAGRLVEATELTQRGYDRELARRSAQHTALSAGQLGSMWLTRGRVATALRWSSESATVLREADSIGMLAWGLAAKAQAAAQAGDAELARATVAELDEAQLTHKGFDTELGLARAWSAAAGGELSRAQALALGAADLARSRGQVAHAMRALHELCRLGDPATAAPRRASLSWRRVSMASWPRSRARTPQPSCAATASRCARSPSASPRSTRCSWRPRRRAARRVRIANRAARTAAGWLTRGRRSGSSGAREPGRRRCSAAARGPSR